MAIYLGLYFTETFLVRNSFTQQLSKYIYNKLLLTLD